MIWGTQPIGGGLKGRHVVHCQEGVVVLVEADSGFGQFPLDERVAVEPVGGMEGKEAGQADDDRSQHLVPDVEVVMGKAAALASQDTVVGVLGRKLGHADAEGAAQFHALEDVVDAKGISLFHAVECGENVVFFAEIFFCPLDGDFVIGGVGFHPIAVIVGALAEHFLVHHGDAQNLVAEVDHLFGSGQAAEIAVEDDAVETVVYKSQQAVKQLREQLHRSPPDACFATRSSGQATAGVNRLLNGREPGGKKRGSKGGRNRRFRPPWVAAQNLRNRWSHFAQS
jgi:hypothetical protein